MNNCGMIGKNMNNTDDLIKNSKHFCILPWVHFHASFNGDVLPCCLFNVYEKSYPLGNINESSVNDIWFGKDFAEIRKRFMEDEYDCRCDYCYKLEESGIQSPRQKSNIEYSDKLEWVRNTDNLGVSKDAKPISLDIRVSNICNFRCRTCFHGSSSSWYNDTIKLYPNELKGSSAIIRNIKNYDKLFSELLPFFSELREIYFCGGEPLLMDEQFRLLKYLDDNNLHNIYIRYNTNLSTLICNNVDITDLWKNFKNIFVFASIDGIKKRGEYIRKGMKWDNIERNINHLLNKCDNIHFILNPVLSIFNAYHIPEMHDYFIQRGYLKKIYDMHINSLLIPTYYSVKILPMYMKTELCKLYKDHSIRYNTNYWYDSFYNYINNSSNNCDNNIKEFVRITNKLDFIRNENILDVCPELKNIMKEYL
jgi:organic radical activating enzyme